MRAKCIKEESVFKPKDKMEALSDFLNIDNAMSLVNQIGSILEQIPPDSFTFDELREIVNQLSQMAADYYNDTQLEDLIEDWKYQKTYESLEDTFQPKSKEEVIQGMREEGWDEMELKDGRFVWLVEDAIRGMAGEPMEVYYIYTEDGKQYPLNNDTLDELPFTMDDRMDLVQFMDNAAESNAASADAWVR